MNFFCNENLFFLMHVINLIVNEFLVLFFVTTGFYSESAGLFPTI